MQGVPKAIKVYRLLQCCLSVASYLSAIQRQGFIYLFVLLSGLSESCTVASSGLAILSSGSILTAVLRTALLYPHVALC